MSGWIMVSHLQWTDSHCDRHLSDKYVFNRLELLCRLMNVMAYYGQWILLSYWRQRTSMKGATPLPWGVRWWIRSLVIVSASCSLQCFDADGWLTGSISILYKTPFHQLLRLSFRTDGGGPRGSSSNWYFEVSTATANGADGTSMWYREDRCRSGWLFDVSPVSGHCIS